MKKSLTKLLFITGFLVGTVGIFTVPEAHAAKVNVKKVKSNAPYQKTAYIAKGKSIKLTASVSVSPNKKANKKVTYKSKNKKIATVNKKGVVKAKKTGSTKITITSAKSKKKKAVISVKVMKNAVKKVTLNRKNATLYTGNTLKLKATVSAQKGASKKVYWTSSNQAIASVSQKGVVTAKKMGSATITVQAIDGSKKKASCKIVVSPKEENNTTPNNGSNTITPREVIQITNLEIYNGSSLHFTIDKTKALTKSNLLLEQRDSTSGSYNRTVKLDRLYTDDQRNYIVEIDETESYYKEGQFLRLSLKGYPEAVREILYIEPVGNYSSSDIRYFSVGSRLSNCNIGSDNIRGYCDCTVSGLPEGFTWKKTKQGAAISGTCSEAGTYKIIFEGEDERGSTFTQTTYLLIYSDTTLQAAAIPEYKITVPSKGAAISCQIIAKGGKKDYTYAIDGESYGLSVNEYGKVSGTIDTPGTYEIPITVTDASTPALTARTTLTLHIEEGKTISGRIVDGEGNGMQGHIHYNCRSKSGSLNFGSMQTTKDGSYSFTVSKNDYAIWASDYYSKFRTAPMYYTVEQDMTLPDTNLNVFPVNIDIPEDAVYWYDDENNVIGQDKVIYEKPGTYTYCTKPKENEFLSPSIYEISFTVKNQGIRITAVKKELTPQITPVSLGTQSLILQGELYTMTSFTPAETGTYSIYSSGTEDTYAKLYDSTAEQLIYSDSGGTGRNFKLTYELEAGKIYYIGVKKYQFSGENTVSVSVTIEKA